MWLLSIVTSEVCHVVSSPDMLPKPVRARRISDCNLSRWNDLSIEREILALEGIRAQRLVSNATVGG
jgi:hypothetical protein